MRKEREEKEFERELAEINELEGEEESGIIA